MLAILQEQLHDPRFLRLLAQLLKAGYLQDWRFHATLSGVPQGGVVSPILSNLFMHYTFDLWMARTHPDLPWCRYADDGLVHCRTEQEAEARTIGVGNHIR